MQSLIRISLLFAVVISGTFFTACENESALEINNDQLSQENQYDYQGNAENFILETYSPWQSGDAAFECGQLEELSGGMYSCNGGFAFKYDVEDENDPVVGTYYPEIDPSDEDEFTAGPPYFIITNYDGSSFDWESNYEVCAVIMKGGNSANVYYMEGGCYGTGFSTPINPNNGTNYGLSHFTFCFTGTECGSTPGSCYEEETAWADGDQYNAGKKGGNWAMYVDYDYDETKTVDLIAGKKKDAGDVTLTPSTTAGMVDITIDLDEGWIFYYDMGDPEGDDNVKVQDYETAPSGNPAIGLFDWKEMADIAAVSFTITVPVNNYYGIHVDVAKEVECE